MTQNQSQNTINKIPFEQMKNEANLLELFKLFEEKLLYNILNCVRVGIVEEYDPLTRIAKIKIANKLVRGINPDGTQKVQDYAPIYSKVWFFGWKDKGITHPIEAGQEGILLFNDRELESWYINGDVNPLSYKRAHNLSDSIFICGLSSLPNILANMQECINIFYKLSNIQIDENSVTINASNTTINADITTINSELVTINANTTTINSNVEINGNITITGNIEVKGKIDATGDVVANGISLMKHVHSGVTTGGARTGVPE